MAVTNRTVALTHAFYDWEVRGRGWHAYPEPVALEPPFVPFTAYREVARRHDDGRHHTWLSRLAESFKKNTAEEPEPQQTFEEPQAEPHEPGTFDEYLVSVPADTKVTGTAILGWLHTFSTVGSPVSFELVGASGCVELRLAIPKEASEHVVSQLRAAVPTLRAIPTTDTLSERWSSTHGAYVALACLGLAREWMLPLQSSTRTDEPLLPLIAAFSTCRAGELGLAQTLFVQTSSPWARHAQRAVTAPDGSPFFADAPELTTYAAEKVASPLFAVAIRLGSLAGTKARARRILRELAAGLSHFGSPATNELVPLPASSRTDLEHDIVFRTTHRPGMLLAAHELAPLLQVPGSGVEIPALYRAAGTKAAPEHVLSDACFLGYNDHDGSATPVSLSVSAKTQHTHVVGQAVRVSQRSWYR